MLTKIGYGDLTIDDEVEEYPMDLHHTKVNYMTPCACNFRYRNLLDSSTLCAEGFADVTDACQGDSGKFIAT